MHDIEALEQAWRRYRLKKKVLPTVLGGVLLLGGAGVYYFMSKHSQTKEQQIHHIQKQALSTKPAPSAPAVQKQTPPRPMPSAPQPPIPKKKAKPIASPTPISPDLAFLEDLQKRLRNKSSSSTSPHPPAKARKTVQKKRDIAPSAVKPVAKKPKQVNTAAVVSATSASKSLIIHTHKTNNTLNTLIQRFNQSKDPKLATYIAQSFYQKGNYKEAVRWSIIANSIDPGNETSWLLFAKAKVALRQKEDAVNALRTYLNQYSSKKIRAYLEMIEASSW